MDVVEAPEAKSLSFAHIDIMMPVADLGQAVQETPTFGHPTEGASEVQSMRTLRRIASIGMSDEDSVDVENELGVFARISRSS